MRLGRKYGAGFVKSGTHFKGEPPTSAKGGERKSKTSRKKKKICGQCGEVGSKRQVGGPWKGI